VVFFGENVPAARVRVCYDLLDAARALLVLGSSLTVFSGHRFVLRSSRRGIPIAIVNQGSTRGDQLAAVTLAAPLGRVLPALEEERRARVIETVRAAFEPFVVGTEVRFTAACWLVGARSR
jgi:NAD-dependent SIR2 family protein deacetylase